MGHERPYHPAKPVATVRFLLKRFVAQRSLGLAVVITMAFSIGVLVAGPLYADASREAILSAVLRSGSVTATNVRYEVFGGVGFDHVEADAAITDAIAALPTDALVRQAVSTVRLGGTAGPSAPLFFRDAAIAHLTGYEGAAPGVGEIVLARLTARALGIGQGDRLIVVGPTDVETRLTVAGVFDPPSLSPGGGQIVLTDRAEAGSVFGSDDEYWFDGRSPFPDPGSGDPQPVLVSRETFLGLTAELELAGEYAWDAYLALDAPYLEVRTVPGRIRAVENELAGLAELSSIHAGSGLGTLISIADDRIENLRIPILLVVFQIGAVTLAVLAGVGALALTRQSFELAVLHSRGFSGRRLLAGQALQAGFSGLAAYPVGLLIGMALAAIAGRANGRQLPGIEFPITMSGVAMTLGAGVAIVGAAVLIALSLPFVRRTVIEERQALSREDRPLLSRVPVELFLLPVGVFSFIQLKGNAQPVAGSGTIDPLVLLAPTLLIFAASFLALRFLLVVLRGADRAIGRSQRLSRYLAFRRLGRAPGAGFAAALLLLLAMGLLVVTTSYRAIVLRNHQDSAHQEVGADWAVDVAPPEDVLIALDELPPGMTGVVRAAPRLQDAGITLPEAVAIDPATYASAGWWREDYSSDGLEEILRELRAPPIGLPLPPDATTLTLELDVPSAAAGTSMAATVQTPDGGVITSPLAPIHVGSAPYDLPLYAGDRILSVTLYAPTTLDLDFEQTLGIRTAAIDGEPLDLASWEPISWRGSSGELTKEGDGYRYDFNIGAGNIVAGITPARGPLPALVAPAITSALGHTFTVTLGGQQTEVEVVAEASLFPSTAVSSPFLVVSSRGLLERQVSIPEAGLTLNEVWAEGAANPMPALRRMGFMRAGDVRAAAPIEGTLAQLPQSLAVGLQFTAAVAGLGLVIVGVAAGLYFAQRRRDYEFAALRAMGAERGHVFRTLALEQGVLLGFAVAIGLAVGYGMLRLVMPSVGPSLGVQYPPPLLVLDGPALLGAVVAIVAATGVGLALAVRFLLRSSVTGVLRGEAE